MSYFNTPYKFGRQTKARIDAIPTSTLEAGDNVFNTDINKEEFWTGSTWINDDCIEATNISGSVMSEGQLVSISSTAPAASTPSVVLSNNTAALYIRHLGVIYRGGSNNAKVVVAMRGYYKVKFVTGQTTTRQFVAQTSATSGEATSTGTKSGGVGAMGVIAETYAVLPTDRLVYCWINSAESF